MTMHPIPIPRAYYFTFSLYLSDRCVFGSASASHTMHTLAQPAALSLRVLGLQANMRILHCQLNLRQGREQAYRSLKVLVQLSCAMPSSVLQLCASLRLLSSLAAIAEGMMAPYQWKRLSIWCMQLMLPKLKRSPSTLTLHHALEFVGLHALYVTSIKRSLLFIACPLHSSWIHTSLVVGRNIYSLLADDVLSATISRSLLSLTYLVSHRCVYCSRSRACYVSLFWWFALAIKVPVSANNSFQSKLAVWQYNPSDIALATSCSRKLMRDDEGCLEVVCSVVLGLLKYEESSAGRLRVEGHKILKIFVPVSTNDLASPSISPVVFSVLAASILGMFRQYTNNFSINLHNIRSMLALSLCTRRPESMLTSVFAASLLAVYGSSGWLSLMVARATRIMLRCDGCADTSRRFLRCRSISIVCSPAPDIGIRMLDIIILILRSHFRLSFAELEPTVSSLVRHLPLPIEEAFLEALPHGKAHLKESTHDHWSFDEDLARAIATRLSRCTDVDSRDGLKLSLLPQIFKNSRLATNLDESRSPNSKVARYSTYAISMAAALTVTHVNSQTSRTNWQSDLAETPACLNSKVLSRSFYLSVLLNLQCHWPLCAVVDSLHLTTPT
mmetsp:Transcript_17851/g.54585  ORF Transcript_17851/g.54585 Transcript_17851/m.54585 type:complete len:614 (+) Transcript_17851:1493-3334(+)